MRKKNTATIISLLPNRFLNFVDAKLPFEKHAIAGFSMVNEKDTRQKTATSVSLRPGGWFISNNRLDSFNAKSFLFNKR